MNGIETGLIDGDYMATIESIENVVDKKNRKVVGWNLKLNANGGEYPLTKRHYLTSEKAVEFLKKELKLIGIIVKDSAELEQKRHQATGVKMTVSVTTNEHGYQVVYVKNVLGKDGSTAGLMPVGW
jgi:hypothetical protein